MKLFRNDSLYTINNKEMVDANNSKDQQSKDQPSAMKIFDASLFKPKVDLKQTPLSWRTKFGFSLGHFFNDSVGFFFKIFKFNLKIKLYKLKLNFSPSISNTSTGIFRLVLLFTVVLQVVF